jgi:hypothetical protein
MKRIGLALVFLLTGCATTHYTLVAPGEVVMSDLYSVKPAIQWSEIKKGDVRLWTINGAELESIRFISGIREGVAIMDITEEKHETPFRPSMSETEVVDAIVDSFALSGAQQVEAKNLRPANFGSLDGFRFELAFLNSDGLEKDGAIVGVISDQSLYLIIYTGTRIHYYPRYAGQFEEIVSSIKIRKPL